MPTLWDFAVHGANRTTTNSQGQPPHLPSREEENAEGGDEDKPENKSRSQSLSGSRCPPHLKICSRGQSTDSSFKHLSNGVIICK
ncbi:hypothetical protein AVEN_142289-1 [Araneus ventricosus]|uniref:Uncharacterized protein n=1 Tax=Araneus ventricosus TaxID=182803 RepID=A0A4Y2MZ74_ARAVE|nr:hypothetical protein AVEN_142289-1 [Araneus ventricosus]